MNANVKNLVGACLLSLAVLAAMMVPGLLMLPSLATAGTQGQVCSSVATSGTQVCNTCKSSPTQYGCDQGTPDTGFRAGYCEPGGPNDYCSERMFICGKQWNCANVPPTEIGTCSSTPICAAF